MLSFNEGQLLAQLNMMNLDGVASAYKAIISNKKKTIKEEIPPFFQQNSEFKNEFHELISNCIFDYKQKEFQKTIITKDDIKNIANETDVERIKTILGSEKQSAISPKIVNKFMIASTGKFDTKLFSAFLEQLSNMQFTILDIIKIDTNITTTIKEETLTIFLTEFISKTNSLKVLENKNEWFKEYYIQYVVSLFEFHFGSFSCPQFMDAQRLLTSSLFFSLANIDKNYGNNPFKISEATSIYRVYSENLSDENDGMKTKKEMKVMCESEFSNAFLDRLFEVMPTFDGMFDYSLFINFYIAYQNMHKRAGINFFFKLLDIDGDSLISRNDALYFYKGLVEETMFDDINEDRFFSELFDTVSGDPVNGITVKTLYKMGSTTFIKKLIDIKCFKEWEQLS